MEINAYKKLYMNDMINCLANMFDYAINVCYQEPNMIAELFVSLGVAEQFERGNPAFISGKSGEEIARIILKDVYQEEIFPVNFIREGKTPEYWAGWALAQYQHITSKRYKDIFSYVTLKDIISMYSVYHEMDVSHFFELMDEKCSNINRDTKLKQIRESRNVSQSELSKLSGVSIRSIQLYEQKVNDIDKAQAQTLYKLARILGCNIEDLLENPESK